MIVAKVGALSGSWCLLQSVRVYRLRCITLNNPIMSNPMQPIYYIYQTAFEDT